MLNLVGRAEMLVAVVTAFMGVSVELQVMVTGMGVRRKQAVPGNGVGTFCLKRQYQRRTVVQLSPTAKRAVPGLWRCCQHQRSMKSCLYDSLLLRHPGGSLGPHLDPADLTPTIFPFPGEPAVA